VARNGRAARPVYLTMKQNYRSCRATGRMRMLRTPMLNLDGRSTASLLYSAAAVWGRRFSSGQVVGYRT
jgi:hypothetical protein